MRSMSSGCRRMVMPNSAVFAHVAEETIDQPTQTMDIIDQWLAGLWWAVKRAMGEK